MTAAKIPFLLTPGPLTTAAATREAMLRDWGSRDGAFIPRDGKLLIVINGAYGHRMARMCRAMGRAFVASETAEDTPPDPARIDALLAADPAITHVAAVHCETTSGILNPLAEIAAVVAQRGRRLLVDSMSGF